MSRHAHKNTKSTKEVRETKRTKSIDLEFAVNTAITRYCEKHPTQSADRQQNIYFLQTILSDSNLVAAKKHVAIERYVKSLKVGMLGRSDLRDYVLQALRSVPIDGLIDELLRQHKAELKSRDMKLNALHAPQAASAAPDLLLASKETDIDELERNNQKLKEKADRLSSINKQLIDKYRALKQNYIQLCRKHGEQYSLSSDVLSQFSGVTSSDPIAIEGAAIREDHEEDIVASSVASNGQRLFRLVPTRKGTHAEPALAKSMQ